MALTLGVVSVSSAQGWFTVSDTKPNTIKAGVFYPLDSDVRDATEDIWITLGYERVIAEMPESASELTAGADWLFQSDLDIIPLTLNWRMYSGGATGVKGTYYGAGIGAYMVSGSGPAAGYDVTRLGYNAFVGMPLNKDLTLELKYHYVKAGGDNVGGLAATVGWKF